jgi:hypothetical protein
MDDKHVATDTGDRLAPVVAILVVHPDFSKGEYLFGLTGLIPNADNLVLPANTAGAEGIRHGLVSPLRIDVSLSLQSATTYLLQGTLRRLVELVPEPLVVRSVGTHDTSL